MTRIKTLLDNLRLPPTRSDAASPRPASQATVRQGLVRSNAVADFGALAPIGKREQVKRFLGAAFAASPKTIALDAPIERQARFVAPVTTPLPPPVANSKSPSASLAARYSALKLPPQDTQSDQTSDPSRAYRPNAALGKPLSTIHEGDEESNDR